MDGQEELIAAARSAAERLGVRKMSLLAFQDETGIGRRTVYSRFGSWPALCAAAGLKPCAHYTRIPDERIFAVMRDCFIRHGDIVTHEQFAYDSSFGGSLLRRRFGGWTAALAAFRRWAAANAPDFPLTDELESRLVPKRRVPSRWRTRTPSVPSWPSGGARAAGEMLGFRALAFAPVNEGGVMVLFGMVAGELGYRIETVAPGFPDCTARRHVGGGRWEGVRVEFEYRSRNFRDHGHDPEGCDVVVCWEHDWPECPIEVLALRETIAALPAR